MLVPVIGFCGEAQSGKDTAASFLVEEYGYQRIAFGDPLKRELAQELIDTTDEWERCLYANHIASSWGLDRMDFLMGNNGDPVEYINLHKPTFRPYLQLYGTEYRRAQDRDYWVKLAAAKVKHGQRYVFTDYRFTNEGELIASLDGLRCAIYRDDAGAENGVKGHESENVEALPKDVAIWNNGTLEHLRKLALGLARMV